MKSRAEIKAKAKEFAFSHKLDLWVPQFIVMALGAIFGAVMSALNISSDSSMYNLLESAWGLVILPVSFGVTYYVLKLIKGKKIELMDALFSKYSLYGLLLGTTILVTLFTFLWSLLLIVPGIIYAFKMAMVKYILADEGASDMSISEVMDKSKEMMDGHKMDYFIFGLSFFGWYLLVAVSFGIAAIWVVPYVTTAEAMFYQELLDEYNSKHGDKVNTKKTTKKITKKS